MLDHIFTNIWFQQFLNNYACREQKPTPQAARLVFACEQY